MSAARLQYGYALLGLKDEVDGGSKAFGDKLNELGLRASKDIQADAQKVAKAVQSGDMTEEEALELTAREVRLLSHSVREDGTKGWEVRTSKPKAPRKPKPKALKQPNLFDQPPPLADTPETDDDDAPTIDQGEAEGEADEFANSDDDSQVPAQNEAPPTDTPEGPADGAEKPAGKDDDAAGSRKESGQTGKAHQWAAWGPQRAQKIPTMAAKPGWSEGLRMSLPR